MIGCRFLSVVIFMPYLQRSGYGLTWKEVLSNINLSLKNKVYVLTWGGIRGAIGLCFALIISEDPAFS